MYIYLGIPGCANPELASSFTLTRTSTGGKTSDSRAYFHRDKYALMAMQAIRIFKYYKVSM